MKTKIFVVGIFIIIAVLYSLAVPGDGGGLTRSPKAQYLNNCRQIAISAEKFLKDSNGKLDILPSIKELHLNGYISDELMNSLKQSPRIYIIPSHINGYFEPIVQYFSADTVVEMRTSKDGNIYTWKRWLAKQHEIAEQSDPPNG